MVIMSMSCRRSEVESMNGEKDDCTCLPDWAWQSWCSCCCPELSDATGKLSPQTVIRLSSGHDDCVDNFLCILDSS